MPDTTPNLTIHLTTDIIFTIDPSSRGTTNNIYLEQRNTKHATAGNA